MLSGSSSLSLAPSQPGSKLLGGKSPPGRVDDGCILHIPASVMSRGGACRAAATPFLFRLPWPRPCGGGDFPRHLASEAPDNLVPTVFLEGVGRGEGGVETRAQSWDTSRPHSSSSEGGYVGVVGGGVCVCACRAQPGPHEPGLKLPPAASLF